MENYGEVGQLKMPERNTSSVIGHAFEMFKGVFWYSLLAVIIYILGGWFLEMISGLDSQLIYDEMMSSGEGFATADIFAIKGVKTYYAASGLFGILISPLFVGLIYLANKYNNGQPHSWQDLFIGYRQNWINIMLYSLISSIIIGISFALCFLPGLFVAPLFLFGFPVLLFENANAIEAIQKSFAIAKENYATVLGIFLLGFLISIAGIIFCFIGILLTFPFIYVVMYSAYCAFVGKPRALINQ